MNYKLIVFLSLITFTQCNTTNPPDTRFSVLTLKLEDVSCTEAWITLETTNLTLPAEINLTIDDSLVAQTISLSTEDTLLYVDSLLPNKDYTFQSVFHPTGQSEVKSNELKVTTMDTTSHNFSFQSWTFGEYSAGSSRLYDVAIVNDSSIYAVGAIYLLDSLGQPDPHAYNLAVWDGNQWELRRIKYYGSCSAVEYPPLLSIWAFSDSNIILTNGGSIGWYNGQQITLDCGVNPLLDGAITKIWGKSSDDVYVVGYSGSIAHDQNGTWTKIESGTGSNIADIYGVTDNSGNNIKYLAAVNAMITIDENDIVKNIPTEQGYNLSSVWGISSNLIYTAGDGVSLYKNNKWEKIHRPDVNTIYYLKGNEYNNIFGLSSTFSILHFNGLTWQYVDAGNNNIYYRMSVKGGITAIVGWQNDKAVVTLLLKN